MVTSSMLATYGDVVVATGCMLRLAPTAHG